MEREIPKRNFPLRMSICACDFRLADAPLLESRVCQYENSTDHNFILDRHPEAENVLIIGGGSGHGFKHGPVIGEMVADAVLATKATPSEIGLDRLLRKRQ